MAFNQFSAFIFDRIKVIAIIRPDQAPRVDDFFFVAFRDELQIFVPLHVGKTDWHFFIAGFLNLVHVVQDFLVLGFIVDHPQNIAVKIVALVFAQ